MFTKEHPVTVPNTLEVFLLDPTVTFLGVPSSCPLPESVEDRMIDFGKSALANHMPMIARPSPNNGGQLRNEQACRCLSIGLDDCSDLGQKAFDVLLGRCYQQFSVVLADVLLV